MCGIAGVHLKENSCPAGFRLEDFVDALLLGIESRGRDATGFVAVTKGEKKKIALDKRPQAASTFVLHRNQLPSGTRTVLLHTRYATQGHESIAGNNHPVVSKTTFVTHNGMIMNDHKLFKEFELPRNAQVDSEIISAMLSEFGLDETKAVSQELSGNFAYAAINPIDNPDEVVLVKYNNPLYVLDHPRMIVWASSKQAIELAWALTIGTPPDDKKYEYPQDGTIIRIKGDELTHSKFKTPATTGWSYNPAWDDDWDESLYDNPSEGDIAWEGDSCQLELPPGDGWTRQADGTWKKIREDGTVEMCFPRKDGPDLRAEIGGNGYEQCWICQSRPAVATLLDGVGESTWKVPCCIPCLREDSEDGKGFQESRRAAIRCADCDRKGGGLEERFGWQFTKDNRRVCVRCHRSGRRIGEGEYISPGEKPAAVPAGESYEYKRCDTCQVFWPPENIQNTWFGTMCDKCANKADGGGYCAECKDWHQHKKLILGSDEKARCKDCDKQYVQSLSTETGGDLEEVATERNNTELSKYEDTALRSRRLYLKICGKVAWELNTTLDFVDWLLVLCPKAQFRYDKHLKELHDQAKKAYDQYIAEEKETLKEKV